VMNPVDKILKNVKDAPTLPTVYTALCDAMANPQSTANDVAKIVSMDQASTVKILRIANSSFFGFSGRIENIQRAIVILGFNEVRNLIMASSVMKIFSRKDALNGFRPSDFWAHSLAVGLIARSVARLAGCPIVENFFVAGILHDIGKLYFYQFAEDDFARVISSVEKENRLIRDAEVEIFGMDHALMGGLLADHWKLPKPIHDAIHYHHFGTAGDEPDLLVASVHVGDILARALGLGHPGDDLVPQPNENVWEVLKLRPGMISKMIPSFLQDYEEAVTKMQLQ
jgi:putative nucleotidyltransferase with HDIG domain